MSFNFITRVSKSVANSVWRRKSKELADFQRRTSDVIVTHNENTQETSLNSIGNSKTKFTFSSVVVNHNAQHGINHVTLDVPYHMCNTGTELNGDHL